LIFGALFTFAMHAHSANFILFVLVRRATCVFSARSFLESGTTASCLWECGAKEIEVEWDYEDPSDGRTYEKSQAFTVGVGANVKYQPTPDQCLSRCMTVPISAKTSCGSLHEGTQKIAKAGEYKLCCVPRPCNYVPSKNAYERHDEGDRIYQGLRPFQPLKPIQGDMVAARTCLCCDQERETLAWDSRVRDHCMVGHLTSHVGNFVKGCLRFCTVKLSDVILRARCRQYCSNYPSHPYGMRSKEARSLIAFTAIAPPSNAKIQKHTDEDSDGYFDPYKV
jgi:hypothetical protein